MSKRGKFYIQRIRYITDGTYDKTNPIRTLKTNAEIRIWNIIPTINSQLKCLRVRIYIKRNVNLTPTYLNNTNYVSNQQEELNTTTNMFKNKH